MSSIDDSKKTSRNSNRQGEAGGAQTVLGPSHTSNDLSTSENLSMSIDETTAMDTMSTQNPTVVGVFRALSDPVRLSIVRKLARDNHKLRSEEILGCSSVTPHSQPCMSYHFAKLVKAGVVLAEKRGTEKVYTLNTTYLSRLGIDVNKV